VVTKWSREQADLLTRAPESARDGLQPYANIASVSAFDDQTYEKWVDWLEHGIVTEITALHHSRQVWRGFTDMVQKAKPGASGTVVGAYTGSYIAEQAIAVRRQTEIDTDVVSIARLIDEIRRFPGVTRARWTGLWPIGESGDPFLAEMTRQVAEGSFDEVAGVGAANFPPASAQADLEKLSRAAAPIAKYANRVIAHTDKRGPGAVPTVGELDAAIDAFGEGFGEIRAHRARRRPTARCPGHSGRLARPVSRGLRLRAIGGGGAGGGIAV